MYDNGNYGISIYKYDDNNFYINGTCLDSAGTSVRFRDNIILIDSLGNVIFKKSSRPDSAMLPTFCYHSSLIYKDSIFYFPSSIDLLDGNSEGAILEFDKNGDTIKSIIFGDTSHLLTITKLMQDNDKWLLAESESNKYGTVLCKFKLVEFDSQFNILWENVYWGGTSYENDVCTDAIKASTGDIYMIGYYQGNGANDQNTMLIKVDSFGNQKWIKHFSNYPEQISSLYELQDGNILLSTYYLDSTSTNFAIHYTSTNIIKIDTAGTIIWNKLYQYPADGNGSTKCVELPDRSIIILGAEGSFVVNSCATQAEKAYIMKLDSLGNQLFYHTYSGDTNDVNAFNLLTDIILMPDKGFLAVGTVSPSCDGTTQDTWILRVDSNGCEVPGCDITGLEQHQNKTYKLEAFPNPTTGYLTVNYTIDDPSCTNATLQLIEIATGRVVMKKDVSCTSTQAQIDMNGFADGVYSLSIQSNLTTPKNIRIIKVQ